MKHMNVGERGGIEISGPKLSTDHLINDQRCPKVLQSYIDST